MSEKALALRTSNADGTSHGGFQWPLEIGSIVTCDDWEPEAKCGNGLHGLLDGWGDYDLLSSEADALWQIVEVDRDKCVEINGKVKFESCVLKYSGDMATAMTMISDYQIGLLLKMVESNVDSASGDYSQLAASGDYSQLAASGYNSQLAASGDYSKLAASGDYSQLAASGHNSQLAASGDYSKLAAYGRKSIAVCTGLKGSVLAGDDCCIALAWWDDDKERYRLVVGYVGEDGIESGKNYCLNDDHKFTEIKS